MSYTEHIRFKARMLGMMRSLVGNMFFVLLTMVILPLCLLNTVVLFLPSLIASMVRSAEEGDFNEVPLYMKVNHFFLDRTIMELM